LTLTDLSRNRHRFVSARKQNYSLQKVFRRKDKVSRMTIVQGLKLGRKQSCDMTRRTDWFGLEERDWLVPEWRWMKVGRG